MVRQFGASRGPRPAQQLLSVSDAFLSDDAVPRKLAAEVSESSAVQCWFYRNSSVVVQGGAVFRRGCPLLLLSPGTLATRLAGFTSTITR